LIGAKPLNSVTRKRGSSSTTTASSAGLKIKTLKH
jgi:hypothetical protein